MTGQAHLSFRCCGLVRVLVSGYWNTATIKCQIIGFYKGIKVKYIKVKSASVINWKGDRISMSFFFLIVLHPLLRRQYKFPLAIDLVQFQSFSIMFGFIL